MYLAMHVVHPAADAAGDNVRGATRCFVNAQEQNKTETSVQTACGGASSMLHCGRQGEQRHTWRGGPRLQCLGAGCRQVHEPR